MVYRKSISVVRNPEVEKIQELLNKALVNVRKYNNTTPFGWQTIAVDGIFGTKTETAVKCFQQHCKIAVNGEVGSETYYRLRNLASDRPVIYSAPYKEVSLITKSKHIEKNDFSIKEMVDKIVDFMGNFDELIKEEIDYATKLGKFDTKNVTMRFNYHISKLDPQMKKLIDLYGVKIIKDNEIKQKSQELKVLKGDSISKRNLQRQMSKAQMVSRGASKVAPEVSKGLIIDINKWNIVQKIADKLKQMGITGEIKVTKLKSIKISSGGVFYIYSLKDIIWDLLQYEEWGTEQWKDDLKKDCYNFLDGLIIGFVSTIIAQLLVLVVGAVAGITISGGWVVAIVVVLALIIGILIGLFISKVCGEEASITKYIFEELVPGAIFKLNML